MLQRKMYHRCYVVGSVRSRFARGSAHPLIFVLLLLMVGGYYFRDFIGSALRERESHARAQELAVAEAISRKTLAQEIEIQLEPIREEMQQLYLLAQAFNAQVEAVIGLPFEVAHTQSSRRLDHAILKSDPFAETWAQLLRARVTPHTLEQKQYVVTQVRHRIGRDTFSDLDKQHLEDLRQWIQQAQHRLNQHQPTIVRLRNQLREINL